MVNANAWKELQNGLPKCNPLAFHIRYDSYRAVRSEMPLANPSSRPRTLTSYWLGKSGTKPLFAIAEIAAKFAIPVHFSALFYSGRGVSL